MISGPTTYRCKAIPGNTWYEFNWAEDGYHPQTFGVSLPTDDRTLTVDVTDLEGNDEPHEHGVIITVSDADGEPIGFTQEGEPIYRTAISVTPRA